VSDPNAQGLAAPVPGVCNLGCGQAHESAPSTQGVAAQRLGPTTPPKPELTIFSPTKKTTPPPVVFATLCGKGSFDITPHQFTMLLAKSKPK